MKNNLNKVLKSFFEFVWVSALTLIVPLSLFLDIRNAGTIEEISFTEILSALFLFVSAAFFVVVGWKQKGQRSLSLMISGFVLCAFIRELDFLFDIIKHGAWVYPVFCIVIAMLIYGFFHWETLLQQIVNFIGTKPYYFLFISFAIILVFSRVFGCGALWKNLLSQNYQKVLKTMVEEGLELLGYILLFYGSAVFFKHHIRQNSDNAKSNS